jgi:hypothetical protein
MDNFFDLIFYSVLYIIIVYHVNYVYKIESLQNLIKQSQHIDYINYIRQQQEILNNLKKYEIKNNPPEYIKLHQLLKDFKQTQSWDNIIAMGDIYKTGSYPRFKNNKNMALECYKIAARCPDGDIAGIAQLKFIEASKDNINEIDNVGDDLPCHYGEEICKFAAYIINNTPYSFFNKPKSQSTEENDINVNNLTIRHPIRRQYPNLNQRPIYRDDLQNVHDHSVTNILKSNIKKLNKDVSHENAYAIIDAIITHPDVSESVKANALNLIENLNSTEKHSTYDITEKDALMLVWNKINKMNDEKQKQNIIEILAKQLDSGVENGHIVCSTGKIARIIGTLDGIDEDLTPSKPLWAIRDEIANLAAKISNSESLNKKKEFEENVIKTYITELNMNKSIIQPIIDEYIEHIE